MKVLFLDGEWTVTDEQGNYSSSGDGTAYNPHNFLVSFGYELWDMDAWEDDFPCEPKCIDKDYLFFRHNDLDPILVRAGLCRVVLQAALDKADLVVAYNAKSDLSWIFSCGFKYEGPVYDPMIFEYVMARGQKQDMSLAGACIRRNVQRKKSELIEEYQKKGIGFQSIPCGLVKEYGIGDVVSLRELYFAQKDLITDKQNQSLQPILDLMNEYLLVLTDMEIEGIAIDMAALDKVEAEFRAEYDALEIRLVDRASMVMGDTPIRLSSPEFLSMLVYSRKVKDKHLWQETFNLGTELRGNTRKKKRKAALQSGEFAAEVRSQTEILYKTTARQCPECLGKGYIQLTKKDGSDRKRLNVCHTCEKVGILYHNTGSVAGFKQAPKGVEDCTVHGFATAKEKLKFLAENCKAGETKEFLSDLVRYNALDSYINTVCKGIRQGVKAGILHTNYNQCVTSTGRLSSTRPNLQNMPRGGKFPARRVFISRFPGGVLVDGDFKALEFRWAGELARDLQVIQDILDGIDVHTETSKVTGLARDDCKPHTFAPIYGATGNGRPPHIAAYYTFFMQKYFGIAQWHIRLQDEAVSTGKITTVTGRQFAFPGIKRYANGSVSYSTMIKNYPVQSVATADCVPAVQIEIWREMKRRKLKSRLVLTVHDSNAADTPPEETEVVTELMTRHMKNGPLYMKQRFGYEMVIPIEGEIKTGPNLLDTVKVLDKAA